MERLEMCLWAADFISTGIGWVLGGPVAAMCCFTVGATLVFAALIKEDKHEGVAQRTKWHRYGLAVSVALSIVLLGFVLVRHLGRGVQTTQAPVVSPVPPPSEPNPQQLVPRQKRHAPAPVKPSAQDNSVHLDNGSKIEQQSSGDCSPNVVGGSSTVNCGPPPLEIKWSVHDVVPPALSEAKHEFKYEKQVMVTVNQTYTPISLGILCDAEIEEVNVGMEGAYMRLNERTGTDADDKKKAFAYFEGSPAAPDKPVWIILWSNSPFNVLGVSKANIKLH